MNARVTIGVPVYHGQAYLEETIACIQAQTYTNYDVIMSVDGPDPVCEDLCRRYLSDSRFSLHVQKQRLGWSGNINSAWCNASSPTWPWSSYVHHAERTAWANAHIASRRRGCPVTSPIMAMRRASSAPRFVLARSVRLGLCSMAATS